MSRTSTKSVIYVLLGIVGVGGIAFAVYQHRYASIVARGNQAVVERRFDSQAYTQAGHFWLARQDTLLFNQGILAYKAGNYPRAAAYFQEASQRAGSPKLRTQTLYNLALVMLAIGQVEQAAELFKETLRLDPLDTDAKFNLERLYRFALRHRGAQGAAALRQAPIPEAESNKGPEGNGQGRSPSASGI